MVVCGRFSISVSEEELRGYLEDCFSIGLKETVRLPRYNVAPTQTVYTLIFGKEHYRFGPMTWGIVPVYGKGRPVINARAETIDDKPLFKPLVRSRRCLILADGFYEWKKDGKRRMPYRMVLKNRTLFLMAGIYQMKEDFETRARCAIITTEAHEKMASIHQRMPVILSPEAGKKWLDPTGESYEKHNLLTTYDDDDLHMYPVGDAVNRATHDAKECIMKKEENTEG